VANSRGMSRGNVSHVESVRTSARIIPYPTGRLFGLALSQALRAWLRSCYPSGTKPVEALIKLALLGGHKPSKLYLSAIPEKKGSHGVHGVHGGFLAVGISTVPPRHTGPWGAFTLS